MADLRQKLLARKLAAAGAAPAQPAAKGSNKKPVPAGKPVAVPPSSPAGKAAAAKPAAPVSGAASKLSAVQQQMHAKLKAAKFRWLNEKLYTGTGAESFEYFQENAGDFEDYHAGFRQQAAKWPLNPLDSFIQYFASKSKPMVIGDFGCGDARLSEALPQHTVHSFDLVAVNPRVTACDMRKLPLPNACLDAAVFCLSLMGTNCIEFVAEAHRVLKPRGMLKVAEVRSRFEGDSEESESGEGMKRFINSVCALGFKCSAQTERNKLFVFIDFAKLANSGSGSVAVADSAPSSGASDPVSDNEESAAPQSEQGASKKKRRNKKKKKQQQQGDASGGNDGDDAADDELDEQLSSLIGAASSSAAAAGKKKNQDKKRKDTATSSNDSQGASGPFGKKRKGGAEGASAPDIVTLSSATPLLKPCFYKKR